MQLFPEATGARPVIGRSFCFVDMRSYEAAAEAVQRGRQPGGGYTLKGKTLNVGWARTAVATVDGAQRGGQPEIATVRVPPSKDATTLFVGNLSPTVTTQHIAALFSTSVTPQVHRPEGKNYAFVEFPNHPAARQAYDSACPMGTDGAPGQVLLLGQPVSVGWAKGRSALSANSGGDCWFCLGSPSVKAHLILSVYVPYYPIPTLYTPYTRYTHVLYTTYTISHCLYIVVSTPT